MKRKTFKNIIFISYYFLATRKQYTNILNYFIRKSHGKLEK